MPSFIHSTVMEACWVSVTMAGLGVRVVGEGDGVLMVVAALNWTYILLLMISHLDLA